MDKFTIKAMAANRNESITKLAEDSEIFPVSHLILVSCGRAKMTSLDVDRLSKTTGIPADLIETRYKKR